MLERPMPPVIADVRLPHLSASKKAGTDIASIRIPDTPDARNDAVAENRPACENSRGAYYYVVRKFVYLRKIWPGLWNTHVSIDSTPSIPDS